MIPLEPDRYYHIYNHANGNELIFTSDENYRFFLEKYHLYISPIADTFCFCLMPNHFHFLVQIKSEEAVRQFFNPNKNLASTENAAFPKFQTLEKLISKQFSNLFSSYTQAFNKQQGRMGSLFMKNFKRKNIDNEKYLRKLIHYIHYNPIEAKLSRTVAEWPHSSYTELLSQKNTLLKRDELITWFNDKDNFIYVHSHSSETIGIE